MIDFYSEEGTPMPSLRKTILREWITNVAREYGCTIGNICYQFCNDERILEVNKQFLNHDYYTDIITFDETQGTRLSGDMLISLDTVRSNAELLCTTYETELHRVIIHGLLHLAGLGDKTPEDEARMRLAEDKALSMLISLVGEDVPLLK